MERANDPLPITVATEDGSLLPGPTEPALRALLDRIGGAGDRFAVAEREPGVYLQTWREADSPFLVERRDGQDVWTELDDPADVTELFAAWAVGVPTASSASAPATAHVLESLIRRVCAAAQRFSTVLPFRAARRTASRSRAASPRRGPRQ